MHEYGQLFPIPSKNPSRTGRGLYNALGRSAVISCSREPMRFRLRTLLIALALLPPVVAGLWSLAYLRWAGNRIPDLQVAVPRELTAEEWAEDEAWWAMSNPGP